MNNLEKYIWRKNILNELKHYTEQRLTQIYENTYYKRKSGFQIIRELLPKVKEFNNTQLGRCMNEAIMLDEYIRLIATNAFEYTDSWRKEKLYKLYRDEESSYETEYEDENSSGYQSTSERTIRHTRKPRPLPMKYGFGRRSS